MSEIKTAVITGASRGIGQSILTHLAKENYQVIGTATTKTGATKISEKIQSLGAKGKGFVLDLCDNTSIEQFIDQVHQDFNPIWLLVNNAGVNADNLFIRMKLEEWKKVIDTNLNCLFQLTQGFVKSMIKQRQGRIINISSVVASSGNFGQVNYSASKSAIYGFTKSLALELGSRGITVNTVSPGFIQTDMTDKLTDNIKDQLLTNIALKSLGKPEDIAHAVVFLASEKARYISGATLHVNGGLYMA